MEKLKNTISETAWLPRWARNQVSNNSEGGESKEGGRVVALAATAFGAGFGGSCWSLVRTKEAGMWWWFLLWGLWWLFVLWLFVVVVVVCFGCGCLFWLWLSVLVVVVCFGCDCLFVVVCLWWLFFVVVVLWWLLFVVIVL